MVFAKAPQKGREVVPQVVAEFLQKTMPFNELDEESLSRLASGCRVDFFPKGTRLLTAGESELPWLYLIQRGGVKTFLTDDGGVVSLKDYRGEGACIGALGIIHGTQANLNVETVEDTFCFLMPRAAFLELIEKQPGVAQYYLKSFTEKIVHTAYSELRHHRMASRANEDLYLFTVTAGDIGRGDLHTIGAGATIQAAAQEMSRHRIGSLLIHAEGDPEQIIGIVTDRDLRTKVVAAGCSHGGAVTTIMSGPVKSVPAQAICFDVLLQMMATGIHHLAVEQGGRVVGVITSHDIMLLQGHSPYYLFKEIVAQRRIPGLYPLARKIPEVVRNLIREGGKAGNITRMISILNDHILERLLSLLEQEMGPPPLRYCWLLMGSEGRREQSFKTDQDNAIIHADPENEEERVKAETYFAEFARRAIDHLVACGYPLCPGEMMASNPQWRQPATVWRDYFQGWISSPDPQAVLNASIIFDFRAGYGDANLADGLRLNLQRLTRESELYLLHMARDSMNCRAPLSFFKNFIVEKNGEHQNKLDIKTQGLQPFVTFARVLALKYGLRETGTLVRLQALADSGHISQELCGAAASAYEMLMQQRLVHQLRQLEEGVTPDNHIDPAMLSELDKRMLRDSFEVIDRLHTFLATIFPVV